MSKPEAATPENLTERVRVHLSRVLISQTVGILGTKVFFRQSRLWTGYNEACESWHKALWKWIDQAAPDNLTERLKGLEIDWQHPPATFDPASLPCAEAERHAWLREELRQDRLRQWAVFQLGMHGPESQDPETYMDFALEQAIAARSGVKCYAEELAKHKQRKPSKDVGDRRLKYQLLYAWIPACLWAFTTAGIVAYLHARYPRDKGLYGEKTTSDARRDLKLYRAPKPLYWGFDGNPPRTLIPL